MSNKEQELSLCKEFVDYMKDGNKPQALTKLNSIIETKIRNRINVKKEAILASKKI